MLVNFFTVTLVTLIVKVVCLLVTVAYYTLAERKIMASVQRRLGPNVVGFWGLLQPLADALKLVGKELVIPSHANSRIFIAAPMGVLLCAFLAWAVVPFHLFDHSSQMSVAAVSEILLNTTQAAANPAAILSVSAFTVAATPLSGEKLGKLLDKHGSFYIAQKKYSRCGVTLSKSSGAY